MRQVTLRLADDVADSLKREAAARGVSMNAFAETGLRALVDPDAAGDEVERLRARLRRAGLLDETSVATTHPPDPEALERARTAFSGGRSLSDYVSEGRGPR